MTPEKLEKLRNMGRVAEAPPIKEPRPVNPEADKKLATLLMMGAAMGVDVSSIVGGPRKEKQATAERDPRFNRLDKIPPDEYFISVGPGEQENTYYACVMAPNQAFDPDNNEDDALEPYLIIAKCRYGFETEDEAKLDAARQFPSLPVLFEGQTYSYPYYNERSLSPLQEAQDRRDRRAKKLTENAEKTRKGKIPSTPCAECGKLLLGEVVEVTPDFIVHKRCHDAVEADWAETKAMLDEQGHSCGGVK